MPTDLPRRARRCPDLALVLFFTLLLSVCAAFFVIEIVDPAPMDVEAALMGTVP